MSSVLVDIGNSRVKWAIKGQGILDVGKPIDVINGHINFNGCWKKLRTPKRVLISNVQGARRGQELKEWIQANWSLSAQFVQVHAKAYGIKNGYHHPDQLGVDRWVCLIAAHDIFSEPVCIVDCGTAITVDILDSAGRHYGGVICPGITLMQNALAQGTSELSLDGVAPGKLLGRDTGTGIYAGTLLAAVGLIEKIVNETEQLLHTRPKLIVTGGAAQIVASRLECEHELVPDLVLRGLSVIESEGD